ncbi:AAA family ATPase [Leptolyngbya cf. ectocarpi LEGE 11479]|uniref:AAA family ATPase n=1 Tax=Leptolyngbya cf. ectocarpi LEGE 11479 TaxID=1828722 RepID=A0A929FDP9_LEPEC|nr:AAA family ATPase [Leptolyngbya ectocarpi]MBE9070808.1 AAA family ATPase [Leptolyngbya cf. ectocarpi LEGE 11479]
MRIDRLEIKNFKKFSEHSLELHPQFTLLVGDNGTGKTSVLDALAIAAGVWLVKVPDSNLANSRRNILSTEIRLEAVEAGDRTQFVECKPVQVNATGCIGNQHDIHWLRQIRQGGAKTSNTDAKEAVEIITQLFEQDRRGEDVWFPVIAYYGAGRAWLPSNERRKKAKQNGASPSHRWEAFYDCFEERIRLSDLQTWFQKEALAAINRQGRMRPGYDVVKFAILRCIPEANDLWFDPDRAEVVLLIDNDPQPFSHLSAGQKMMVALIADIAIKVVTQNAMFLPESIDFGSDDLPCILQKTMGLILIDEIDVHLHPKWQRQVVNDLKTTFPSIQFVCTTHSPFIIQSINQGELRSLDSEDLQAVEYENQSIEDIAEEIQLVDVPQQSLKARELAQATEQYFELLQNPDRSDPNQLATAEAEYRKAAESFSSNPGLSALLKLEAMAKVEGPAE